MSGPTIRPNAGFNAQHDAEHLEKAMKGIGCDKNKVILVLCGKSNHQRQEVAKAYKVQFGKDLLEVLKSELSGDFEKLILALMEPAADFDAREMNRAIKIAYRRLFGKELEDDIRGDTSGHFQRLLVSLLTAGREDGYRTDHVKANHDARDLYRAGEQKLGTDEDTFNRILATQNFTQLQLVFAEYQKITGNTIEKAIEGEFGKDDNGKALQAVVKCIQNRPAYFAELLYSAMKGLGTRDDDLIRVLVSQIDLANIREEYKRLYNTSLEDAIKADCSGAYKDGLLALVKGN
ncbi:annexin [Aphelenchoides avenae]|nr:annexin [Aphelenchus avenae]